MVRVLLRVAEAVRLEFLSGVYFERGRDEKIRLKSCGRRLLYRRARGRCQMIITRDECTCSCCLDIKYSRCGWVGKRAVSTLY